MTKTSQDINPYLVVSAHRGYWRDYPENSFPAFYSAALLGADALEIDVSETADRVPVLMHDSDVSRTTSYQGSNGAVTSMSFNTFSSLYVRDRHGCVTSTSTSSLKDLLKLFTSKVGALAPILTSSGSTLEGPALVIDIKNRVSDPNLYTTLLDAITAYKSIYGSSSPNYRAAVAFKVPLRVMPQGSGGPARFASDVAANTGDSSVPQMIYVKFPDDPVPGSRPTAASAVPTDDPTFMAYLGQVSTLHFETNEKYLNDTMTPYRQYLTGLNRAIAGYSPENFFPEGQPHSGRCCGTEDTYYAQGSGPDESSPQPACFESGPNPCLDLTGRWDYLAATQMTVMTTERVDDAITFAKGLSRRNLPPHD